jgi:hypothetical protein
MFPVTVNTTVLAIACANLQPYNRTGIEAAEDRVSFLSSAVPLEVGGLPRSGLLPSALSLYPRVL